MSSSVEDVDGLETAGGSEASEALHGNGNGNGSNNPAAGVEDGRKLVRHLPECTVVSRRKALHERSVTHGARKSPIHSSFLQYNSR